LAFGCESPQIEVALLETALEPNGKPVRDPKFKLKFHRADQLQATEAIG
jgi:hypothetical protein